MKAPTRFVCAGTRCLNIMPSCAGAHSCIMFRHLVPAHTNLVGAFKPYIKLLHSYATAKKEAASFIAKIYHRTSPFTLHAFVVVVVVVAGDKRRDVVLLLALRLYLVSRDFTTLILMSHYEPSSIILLSCSSHALESRARSRR